MRKRFVVIGVVVLTVVSLVAIMRLRKPVLKPITLRQVTEADVAQNPALRYAAKKYRERGAKYIWGTNDCSVFVSDYLLKQPVPPKTRLTTVNLDQADVEPFGVTIEGTPKAGDVLNYRYVSKKTNERAGHCGVVVAKPDGLWVMHNCVTRGLVIQKLQNFIATAEWLGVKKYDVTILRPMSRAAATSSPRSTPRRG